ncbi:hypothetical protein SAMN05421743_10846 [Thalassobacillus cyri]|uniref:Uncharacterized protein n=1 Tax=Thalassobacillus cyri TaxID=571932 RepID=A0A1H4DX80_9BACI|nr:hypothetical protein [Thalassobacillus cyri]SEA77405.1 hypothetical protein SAMN05421743_10846 [Thalassobacillus cyri]
MCKNRLFSISLMCIGLIFFLLISGFSGDTVSAYIELDLDHAGLEETPETEEIDPGVNYTPMDAKLLKSLGAVDA